MAWPQVGSFAEDRRRLHHTADIQASRRISRVPNHYVCLRGSSKGRWRLSDPNCPDTWAVGAETSTPADVRPDGVFPLGSLLVPCEPRGVIVIQGCRHAEWPKDTAPLQSGYTIHFAPNSVDAECRPPQTERFWKRATKLRAISRTGSRRGPVRQHCRRGKLLPTRRTLLQIDVRGPRRSIVDATINFKTLSYVFLPAAIGSQNSPTLR
jgi:hypothetical protein